MPSVRRLLPLLHLLTVPAVFASTAAHPDNCEPLRTQIETRIRGGGIDKPGLVVVDQAAVVAGRVVGSCAMGSRKIVQTQQLTAPAPSTAAPATSAVSATAPAGSAASAAKRKDEILTECKDGSMSVGGRCGR